MTTTKKLAAVILCVALLALAATVAVFAEEMYIEKYATIDATVMIPSGGGNPDINTIRDGYVPGTHEDGTEDSSAYQYDTYVGATEVHEEYFQYTFNTAVKIKQVEFTEGCNFGDGGAFIATPVIQVLVGGEWKTVGEACDPEYHVGETQADFLPNYETFVYKFDAVETTAVRLLGTPWGTANFCSVGEIKVLADVDDVAALGLDYLSIVEAEKEAAKKELLSAGFIEMLGHPIATVTVPEGGGNKDITCIQDGVTADTDNTNSGLQYDTVNESTPDANKWTPHREYIGYEFDESYTVVAVVFNEGGNFFDGGWFYNGDIGVECRVNGEWVDVESTCSPEYPESDDQDEFLPGYETYTFTLAEPVVCDGVRIEGDAGGSAYFISCTELKVQIDSATIEAPATAAEVPAEAPVAPEEPATEPEAEVVPDAEPAVEPAPVVDKAPVTSDAAVVLIVLAVITGTAVIVSRKVRV